MHLVEALALRPVPAAGVFLCVTRRCPLSCAHCSTSSRLDSEESPGDLFRRFVRTFTPADRPELLLLTGGEPLLRPDLVYQLARRAHSVGSRVWLISGVFFARRREVPPAIRRAIAEVDHFSASLDAFHEAEVPREAVFRVLRELVERGQDVSLQVVGLRASDPYLSEVTRDVRRAFSSRVPLLVGQVAPVGRARSWMKDDEPRHPGPIVPLGCHMAAWPVVSFDGTIVACCNQAVVDGPAPPHLRLGHALRDDWATVRERCLASPMVRALRRFGPEYLADRFGSGVKCAGYCSTCHGLSGDPGIAAGAERLAGDLPPGPERRPDAGQFAAEYGVPAYAPLVRLGYEGRE
jgi:pyruvate-formate lyase-activating enzyme